MPDERLPLRHALTLGAIQGPAELLPVSSSGHLVLVPALFDWPYGELEPELRKSFEVALHGGAAIALLIGLRHEVVAVPAGFQRPQPADADALVHARGRCRFALVERQIEQRLGQPVPVALALIAGGAAMALADGRPQERERREARPRDALAIGLAQACALAPGVSRNGATLTAARWRGFKRSGCQRHLPPDRAAGHRGSVDPRRVGGSPLAGESARGSRSRDARRRRGGIRIDLPVDAPDRRPRAQPLTPAVRLLSDDPGARGLDPAPALAARRSQLPPEPTTPQTHRGFPLLLNSGVSNAAEALAGLVEVLGRIDPGRAPKAIVGTGHYANVLAIDDRTGIALCTDGVGTKVIVAMQAGRFDTIGIDCVAMNVNDLICVGAEPLAMVDYLAVEQPDPDVLRAIGEGLKRGAELAGIEIPGGELAELPELIRGHPSPLGFDLAGAAFGTVPLDRLITGAEIEPGDAVIALPASGIHSNGLTLARRTLLEEGRYSLDDVPPELGRSIGEELLEPTSIYVRAVLELIGSEAEVRGLAHITGDGLLNLLRLNEGVGYEISEPLPEPPVFGLIASAGGLPASEMHQAFNMGVGFCCIVPQQDGDAATSLLAAHHPTARRIGQVTAEPGVIRLPSAGITGRKEGFE